MNPRLLPLPMLVGLFACATLSPRPLYVGGGNPNIDPNYETYVREAAVKDSLAVPFSLWNEQEFIAQALACAHAYNEALNLAHRCDTGDVTLRALSIVTLTGAGLASTVAALVPSPQNTSTNATRNGWLYTAAGLGTASALTGSTALFLKCGARASAMSSLANDRMKHLQRAAKYVACAKPRKRAKVKKERPVSVDGKAKSKMPGGEPAILDNQPARNGETNVSAFATQEASASAKTASGDQDDDSLGCPDNREDGDSSKQSLPDYFRGRASSELLHCYDETPTDYDDDSAGSK